MDFHSFCYTRNPDAFTQLGQALHFYGVLLRQAPTPQAKGKIERRHDDWQKRLVPLLAAARILEWVGANHLLDQFAPHANPHEIHRELGQTPLQAHQQALAENRSVLRPVPNCPWWPYSAIREVRSIPRRFFNAEDTARRSRNQSGGTPRVLVSVGVL